MIRVVLDTNVLVSAVRADRGPLSVICESWLTGRFQVYVSGPLLDEVERTLTKPYFAARLGADKPLSHAPQAHGCATTDH